MMTQFAPKLGGSTEENKLKAVGMKLSVEQGKHATG
jgi:hypothetical protein